MRISAFIPMACALVGFILGLLCLFAGNKPGFMEEYHIVTLNTSTLGHNLIPQSSASSHESATSTSSAMRSLFSGLAQNITGEIEGELGSLVGDIADKLAQKLGIKEWYSLHLMDLCEGTYESNATIVGAALNVTSCTNQTAMYHFDISDVLNEQLQVGPLHINLTDIDWPSDIQKGLNDLSGALDAIFVIYAIGIASAGCAFLTAIPALFLKNSRITAVGNLAITSTSVLSLLIASAIVSVVQAKAAHVLNKYGNDIGLYAYKGDKFLALTWSAVALMIVAALMWLLDLYLIRRNKLREYMEKISHRDK